MDFITLCHGKCLNYSDDKKFMDYCRNDNKNQAFSIKNGKICSRTNKCLRVITKLIQ